MENLHRSYGVFEDESSKNRGEELQGGDKALRSQSTNTQFAFVGTGYSHARITRLDTKRNRFKGLHKETLVEFDSTSSHDHGSSDKLELIIESDASVEEFKNEEPIDEGLVTTKEAFYDVLFGSWLNVLLVFLPFGWFAANADWSPQSIFWLNFLAMIPMAAILGDFTEEIAAHTNQTIGGLVNASFGNLVEVIIALEALRANEIRVVQASMLGSVFSNLLLVLGSCFFFGGLKYEQQKFNSVSAAASISLLALSSIALVLPTPFAKYYDVDDGSVLMISRFAALFLISMYIQLLVFQLCTHKHIFADEEDENVAFPLLFAIGGLIVVTFLLSISSEFLVGSIDGFCESSGISKTFVGIIILPVVGNAVEHMTAITVATKDKMDLAMGVAIGSCTQIALFVAPVTVIYGWINNIPMNLNYPHFEIALYLLSVIIVSLTISTQYTNWLLGTLLISTYFMIAIGFWFEKVEPSHHSN